MRASCEYYPRAQCPRAATGLCGGIQESDGAACVPVDVGMDRIRGLQEKKRESARLRSMIWGVIITGQANWAKLATGARLQLHAIGQNPKILWLARRMMMEAGG
jgi:hypothetical protein